MTFYFRIMEREMLPRVLEPGRSIDFKINWYIFIFPDVF